MSGSRGFFAVAFNTREPISGNAGAVAVPPGTYGNFTVSGHSTLVLGVKGSPGAVVYNLQSLTLNGGSVLSLAGPIVLNVALNVTFNGGSSE